MQKATKGEELKVKQLKRVRKDTLKKITNQEDMLNTETQNESATNSEFLSNISHELKTPLNSILSATALLKDKSLDKDTKNLVDIIGRSGQYLFSLMNNVLDHYGLINNQLTLDHLNFNLKEELEEIQTIFREKLKTKGLGFDFSFDSKLPEHLIGDSSRLKQILVYLLDNAIKHTYSGKIGLMVNSKGVENGLQQIQFVISDTGIGIHDIFQDKIRKSFLEETRTVFEDNTGNRLSLIRKLCVIMGGEMGFESQVGVGTTFFFTVKMDVGHLSDNSKKGTKRILLVEDNLINQKLTHIILKNQGFKVEVANNGKIAVEKFKTLPFDLILMDIQMPVMDGLEATRAIRKIEIEQGQNPGVMIVALTANSQLQDKKNCIAAGMDHFINKPFKMENLQISLQQLKQKQS